MDSNLRVLDRSLVTSAAEGCIGSQAITMGIDLYLANFENYFPGCCYKPGLTKS